MPAATRRRRRSALLATGIILAGIAFANAWQPADRPVVATGRFDPASVARGEAWSRLGDCAVCHAATGGAPYAGGRPLQTPFGTVYSTNITPDPDTGIGSWSLAAFQRAMQRGIARDGTHLYPAFPYDHYTHVDPTDIGDLYAFLMTRRPVRATAPVNRLVFPLGFRPLLAGWNLLFLHGSRVVPDPARSADWNRGRYLVEGLAHCGGCHTPRNLLGAEQHDHALAGGWSDGWYAPPLNHASPALRPWTAERLFIYLRTGLDRDHAAAAGPMGPVAGQLAQAPEADVRAIAVYVADRMARPNPAGPTTAGPDRATDAAVAQPVGAALFAGACATCHGAGAPMMLEGRPALGLGTPLRENTPRDVIQIMLQGLEPPVGEAGPYMPAFAASLTDSQIAQIAAYLRARFGDHPPWPSNLERAVRTARASAAQ